MESIDKKYEYFRKYNEYEMKIIKMAGYVSDYYIDRAIETEDFSIISSHLIDYFSAGKAFDVGYLYSKYKEFELDEKIEDLDFNVDEWYKIKYEVENYESLRPLTDEEEVQIKMSKEEYIQYMIDKRKKEVE